MSERRNYAESWIIGFKTILFLYVIGQSYASDLAITPWYILVILLYLSVNVSVYIFKSRNVQPFFMVLAVLVVAASSFYIHPLLFKLEQINADKTTTELKHFGKTHVSEFMTVDAKKINVKRATGVVYIPGTHELRSVPTLFKVNADGTVTVEIKKTGSGIYALIQQDIRFSDAIPSWAREDVAQAAAKLIVSGESNGSFGGDQHISRAEIISIVVKALGILPDDSNSNFKDVDPKSRYAREIAAAKAAGLVKGRSGDTFDPNSLITREELAVMLSNVLNYSGKKNEASQGMLNQFKDHSKISSYAKSSVAFVVEQKIMQGVSASKLDPQSHVTKAQTVVTVMRLLRAVGLSN